MKILAEKFKESLSAVFPFIVIVLVLHFTLVPLEAIVLTRFLIGAVAIIIGLAIFLFGVDVGIDPIGKHMGSSIAKTNNIWFVVGAVLLVGFFISVAEPDLHILAGQVDIVTSGVITKFSIVLVVSIGIGILLSLGFLRILFNFPLNKMLILMYLVIFGLAIFSTDIFRAISFDASGATTGALTVPFILSMALGVSSMKKNSKDSETDSFGLLAIASGGAIIGVMVMSLFTGTKELTGTLNTDPSAATGIIAPFLAAIRTVAIEVFYALAPIVLIFLLFQFFLNRLRKNQLRRIIVGVLYAFIGITIFLTGVNAGFMEVGAFMGYQLASLDKPLLLIAISFALGFVTVLAEPAVHALTNQVEAVTSGYVKKSTVLTALTLGIGVSVALAMVKILVPGLKLWHYLLPGYAISLALTFFVPKLFVGVAFDSGGVASGPMTATFILAFAQGVAEAVEGADVLLDGFGIIALVALTPLITLQILGLIYQIKSRKGGLEEIESEHDA